MRYRNPLGVSAVSLAMLSIAACGDHPVASPEAAELTPAASVLANEWQPFTWHGWACHEPVLIKGRFHVTWSVQLNGNRWLLNWHQNVVGSGTGEFSGGSYHLTETHVGTENLPEGGSYPLSVTYADRMTLTGQGALADLRARWRWHLTINANGTVTAQVEESTFECGDHGPPGFEGTLVVNVVDDLDDGSCSPTHCSLREAIHASNEQPGGNIVAFRIPGPGPHTIQPRSGLPTITDPVVVDGTTEPSFAGSPIIEIDGATAGSAHGLEISAANSTVRGLVINRFSGNGILIDGPGASGNVVEGNYIGTDVTGTVALGNEGFGVGVWSSSDNVIGGNTPEARNVISGNGWSGVGISEEATGNTVVGNYIGTDVTGSSALGNGERGVEIQDAADNTVGGTTGAARNVISGNSRSGIAILGSSATGNTVVGNYIGTDVTGTVALGNEEFGVGVWGSPDNVIGGNTPEARNVISGNGWSGVGISEEATGNTVVGNYIGTDVTGTVALGNAAGGVLVSDGASDNWIGGRLTGSGNIIAFSGQSGIRLATAGSGNAIQGNAIYANGGLGIDLGPPYVTSNDPGDTDTGANDLQNFPVLASATGSSVAVSGALNSTPTTEFRIEFFANVACDPSGYGEGETFVGYTMVTTDGLGDASFTVTFPTTVPTGTFITASATNPNRSTSEFSACIPTT